MTDEQFCKVTEMIKTQNDMIARIGLILVRMTWLMVTIILIQILAWIF
jgi:hypothetical protein